MAVVSVQWHGVETVAVVYRAAAGNLSDELLFRNDESRLEIVTEGQPWSFDADGELLRLASEAQRMPLQDRNVFHGQSFRTT